MTATISITESAVLTGLRAWLIYVLGSSVEVIQELENRVPTPKSSFVLMNRVGRKGLSFPIASYVDEQSVGTIPAICEVIHTEPVELSVQVDCYGPTAGDMMEMISATWHTMTACGYLSAYAIKPLFNDDARQMPFITGEKQYVHRWTITLHLQYNPAVALWQDFMSEAEAGIINVDRTYPA